MSTRGQKPQPTQMRVIRGNPGKRAMPKNEAKSDIHSGRCPPGLSKEARRHWRKVSKQLIDSKLMTKLDEDALVLYCEAYARWSNANKEIEKYGMVVNSPSGYPIQSPFLAISNKAFEQMKAILVEFGMTPSSRTRVSPVSDGGSGGGWSDL